MPTFLQKLPHQQHSRTCLLTLWITLFPRCLVESHYTLTCFQYTLSTATEEQGICLTSAVGTGGEDKKLTTKILWEEVVNKQFTNWLKCVISLTGTNLYKKHPELADLEDSTKFHDNVCGHVKPPTHSSPALFVFHLVICTNRSEDANCSFHQFSWYTKNDFGS